MEKNTTKALEMENVCAGYHGKPVLHDISLSVPQGDMAGLIGPNGAGKTTILRCITGLCRPSNGTVKLFGTDLNNIPPSERARLVAVVPQELETPMPFTVRQVVMIGRTACLNRWTSPGKIDHDIVERAMAYVDVADMKDRPFTELSGGEKQRTIVAMALAQEPRMILMDEATSHLDINHKLEIMQIAEKLNREEGVTVVMISHDLNLASEFCKRLVLLDKGKIVKDGTPEEVLTENTLKDVYRCDVRVQRSASGAPMVLSPIPGIASAKSGKGTRLHVIAGGGCGEEILRRLTLSGYSLSCGVLNKGDTDADICHALGARATLEKPFSPIGSEAVKFARGEIDNSRAVIVSEVPFGPGNTVNLELAAYALEKGVKVLLPDKIEQRDYTVDKSATAMHQKLAQDGAVTYSNIADLIKKLENI